MSTAERQTCPYDPLCPNAASARPCCKEDEIKRHIDGVGMEAAQRATGPLNATTDAARRQVVYAFGDPIPLRLPFLPAFPRAR